MAEKEAPIYLHAVLASALLLLYLLLYYCDAHTQAFPGGPFAVEKEMAASITSFTVLLCFTLL